MTLKRQCVSREVILSPREIFHCTGTSSYLIKSHNPLEMDKKSHIFQYNWLYWAQGSSFIATVIFYVFNGQCWDAHQVKDVHVQTHQSLKTPLSIYDFIFIRLFACMLVHVLPVQRDTCLLLFAVFVCLYECNFNL